MSQASKAEITLSRLILPPKGEEVKKNMNVFVVDAEMKPMMPCRPAKARMLLDKSKAAVLKRFPFTIVLKHAVSDVYRRPIRLKIDPGSRFTGLAILDDNRVVWAAEIKHRGLTIKSDMESRRAVRRGRRQRKTRYRPPRFLNRTRPKGWLPPSLMSRVYNITTWVKRIKAICPITDISMELVRFDTQMMVNPEISGVEYQQGELAGYEVREYLLEKWDRKCAYCGKKDVPLQIEHIIPKARGGSNRVSNLTLACQPCNQKKGTQTASEFGHPETQKKAKMPLKDAAAVNATRWRLFNELKTFGLPVECGSGGLTKFNRSINGITKSHWADAACVGKSTPHDIRITTNNHLSIAATGRGKRQMCITDKYGFPIKHRGREKLSNGFQTGDMVLVNVPMDATHHGKPLKTIGRYISRINGISRGKPALCLDRGKNWWVNHRFLKKIQSADGYGYAILSNINTI